MGLTYKDSGVDISKIKKSQGHIGKIIAQTHKVQKKSKIVGHQGMEITKKS